MKDKKFLVLCILGVVWLVLFTAMVFGTKIHPRVEQLVTFLCVGWFAYWSLSALKEYFRKDVPPAPPAEQTTEQTTEQTQTNAKSKKSPKSVQQ